MVKLFLKLALIGVSIIALAVVAFFFIGVFIELGMH